MGSFGSSQDEFGTGNIIKAARIASDISTDDTFHLVLDRTIGKIIMKRPISPTKSFLITAGSTLDWEFGSPALRLTPAGAFDLFVTLPLKSGKITAYVNDTQPNVQAVAHTLNTGDTVKIIGSREQTYLGNHVVTDISTDQFQIPVPFVSVDGQGRWEQTKVRVSAQADSSGKTLLTCVANPFKNGDWINVVSNGGANGNFQVESKLTDSIVVDTPFIQDVIADIDVGFTSIILKDPTILNFGTGKLWKLQGKPDLSSFVQIINYQLIGFELGQTSDLSMGYAASSLMVNCFGHQSFGDIIVGLDVAGYIRNVASFLSNSYKAIMECDFTLPGSSLGIHLGQYSLLTSQSVMNIPQTANPLSNGVTMIGVLGAPTPGVYYNQGPISRSSTFSIALGGTPPADAVIPVTDTTNFRVGDLVKLSETSNMEVASTAIVAIVQDVSIQTAFDDNGHPTGTTATTVTDVGGGNIKILFASGGWGTPLLDPGDTIFIANTVLPDFYIGQHKVIAVDGAGGATPEVTIKNPNPAGTVVNVGTNALATGDAGILITNLEASQKSLDQTAPLFDVIASKGTQDSMSNAEARSNGTLQVTGAQNTQVAVQDTTPVAGDWIEDAATERFSVNTTTGQITYNGIEDITVLVRYQLSAAPNSGGAQTIDFDIHHNGSRLTKSVIRIITSVANVGTYVGGLLDITKGDTFQLFRDNTTNGTDTDVTVATVLITKE